MNEKHKKKISKFLSLVLRHKPDAINVKLDKNGWIGVETLHPQNTAFPNCQFLLPNNNRAD